MRRLTRFERFFAVSAVCALALVLTGVALGAAARHTSAARVSVTFSDSAFRISSQSFEAGPTTFVVLNRGRRSHAFEISGPGLKSAHTVKLTAGKSTTLTVTLRPGAYMLSDPVGLSVYNVQYIDVAPAATVSATGTSAVVAPAPVLPPMCGATYTP
jgi:hypothetical protein